jgi:hypothetical protein
MLLMEWFVRGARMFLAVVICVAWLLAAIPFAMAFGVMLLGIYLSDLVKQRGEK